MFGGLFKSAAPTERRSAGRGAKGEAKGGKGKGRGKGKQRSAPASATNDTAQHSENEDGEWEEEESGDEQEEQRMLGNKGGKSKAARRRAERQLAKAQEAAAKLTNGDSGSADISDVESVKSARKAKPNKKARELAKRRAENAANAELQQSQPTKKKRKSKSMDIAAVDEVSKSADSERVISVERASGTSTSTSLLSAASAGTSLGRAAQRLQGSRFRWLNELLYTSKGEDAKTAFDNDPSLALAYHEGFRVQASKWPRNPLDDIIKWCKTKVQKGAVIGDFGCGEARLALEVGSRCKVHSFDLIAINDRITPCNLANVPIPDNCLDVAVFCLALMGTDWLNFMREAHRCLKVGGTCHIAEVESRFADQDSLVASIEALGFRKLFFNPTSFFVDMRFTKTDSGRGANDSGEKTKKKRQKHNPSNTEAAATGLGSCIYRRR